MKKIIYSIFILFVALLSSCVTKDISIVKRKYSAGYYVNVNHHKNVKGTQKTEHNNIVNLCKQNEQNSAARIEEPNTIITEALISQNKLITPQQNYTASKNKANSISGSAKKKHLISDHNYQTKSSKAHNYNLVDKNKINDTKIKNLLKSGNKTKTELVVLVILSLFPILALIAMYLKDGEQITMNFWVDLILHFTVIGYLIFALLVVFDVINLA